MKKEQLLKLLPHIVAPLLFIIISYAYFSPLIEGKKIEQHDITMYKGSAKEILDYKKATGETTLWTNSMFGGMPAYLISVNFIGNQLRWVNRLLEIGERPASFIFITMLGFYILLLVLGINPWLSMVGSIAYGLSTYFFVVIGAGHNAKIHAISYVAPMLAGVIQAFKGKYWAGFSLFALFFGLNLFTGHPQITYYAGFIVLALFVAYLIEAIKGKLINQFIKAIAVLSVAGVLAFGANFSRLWFTYDYGKDSIRGKSELTSNKEDKTSGLDKTYATDWSYGVMESFNLLIPNLMGGSSNNRLGTESNTYEAFKKLGVSRFDYNKNYDFPLYWGTQPGTSGPVYIGAIVVFLFVFGLFLVKGPQKWALFAVTVLAIFLAMGRNFMPLTNLFLDFFPGYNKFRTVTMILYIAELTMPLLAFIALKDVYEGKVEKKYFFSAFKWSSIILGTILILFLIFPKLFFSFTDNLFDQLAINKFPETILQALQDDRKNMLRADAFRSLVFIGLSAVTLWGFFAKKIKPIHFLIAIGLLITIDMWVVNKRYMSNKQFVTERKAENPITPTRADLEILRDQTLDYRVMNFSVSTFNDATTSNFHKSIGGYHGAKMRRYQELVEQHIAVGNMAVLNMLNTRYFIQPTEQGPVARLNPEALGTAWFVDSVKIVANADEEIAALKNFNPSHLAIVDQRFSSYVTGYSSKSDSSQIKLVDYKPNKLSYKCSTISQKVAVFSEIYYPKGWKVSLDGKPTDHFRVNYVLRAMLVPPGEHEVVFSFEPEMFSIGKNIDFASSILIILIFLGWAGWSVYTGFSKNKIQ